MTNVPEVLEGGGATMDWTLMAPSGPVGTAGDTFAFATERDDGSGKTDYIHILPNEVDDVIAFLSAHRAVGGGAAATLPPERSGDEGDALPDAAPPADPKVDPRAWRDPVAALREIRTRLGRLTGPTTAEHHVEWFKAVDLSHDIAATVLDSIGAPSGLPVEPSEEAIAAAVEERVKFHVGDTALYPDAAASFRPRVRESVVNELTAAYRVDAQPEREDENAAWHKGYARARADLGIELREARAEIERRQRLADAYYREARELETEVKRLRAAKPLTTDVLRNPTEELIHRVQNALPLILRQHGVKAALSAIADYLDSQSPPSSKSDPSKSKGLDEAPPTPAGEGDDGLPLYLGRLKSPRSPTGWTNWQEVRPDLVEAYRKKGWDVVEFPTVAPSPPVELTVEALESGLREALVNDGILLHDTTLRKLANDALRAAVSEGTSAVTPELTVEDPLVAFARWWGSAPYSDRRERLGQRLVSEYQRASRDLLEPLPLDTALTRALAAVSEGADDGDR